MSSLLRNSTLETVFRYRFLFKPFSSNKVIQAKVGAWFYSDLAGIRVKEAGALELGPTLDEYNALLPSAEGTALNSREAVCHPQVLGQLGCTRRGSYSPKGRVSAF